MYVLKYEPVDFSIDYANYDIAYQYDASFKMPVEIKLIPKNDNLPTYEIDMNTKDMGMFRYMHKVGTDVLYLITSEDVREIENGFRQG